MSPSQDGILTEIEKDALKEIINIAFGKAAASLADVIGLYVILNVPKIEILQPDEIQEFIGKEINESKGLSIVEQYYIGKIKGAAFLVLSYESNKQLVALLDDGKDKDTFDMFSPASLEQETVVEMGNIIIGACVSKIADLLQVYVTYTPPRFLAGKLSRDDLPQKIFDRESYVIVLKTIFQFEKKDISGFLFLVNSFESIQWLKEAIQKYLKNYE